MYRSDATSGWPGRGGNGGGSEGGHCRSAPGGLHCICVCECAPHSLFRLQEEITAGLHLCEIVAAIGLLAVGGHFMWKVCVCVWEGLPHYWVHISSTWSRSDSGISPSLCSAPLRFSVHHSLFVTLYHPPSHFLQGFNLFEHPSFGSLFIMACLFEEVVVYKPCTSKPANRWGGVISVMARQLRVGRWVVQKKTKRP